MDNKKIGDLISKLRKEKGLTQQALGDLVGVGSGAVSKWERGLTLPDIGIINELSQILGISSDELLSGEIKEQSISEVNVIEEINDSKEEYEINNHNKYNLKKILLISLPIILIITLIIILYNNNKTYAYNILSTSEEYYVEGKVIFRQNDISIVINKIEFMNDEFNSITIKNYEYDIRSHDKFIIGVGYNEIYSNLEKPQSVKEFFKNFSINYDNKTYISRRDIEKNGLVIRLGLLLINDDEITKEIKFSLDNIKK